MESCTERDGSTNHGNKAVRMAGFETVNGFSASVPSAAHPEVSIRPVFLVGMNGSGTTMLRDSLCRHSELYGFLRETRLLPHVLNSAGKMGGLDDDNTFLGVWRRVQAIPAFSVVNGGAPPPIPENWRQYPRDIGFVVDAFFRYFAYQQGKTRWCEKTPQHVQHLRLLSEVFPGAKFVHLIRDARACAASFHRRWGRRPELTVYRWKKAVQEGREQGASLGDRYLEVRYEELTEDPEHWMRIICRFLDLPFDPRVLESRQPQSRERNRPGRIRHNPASWDSHFPPAVLRRLERIAGAYLEELGYATSHIRGSEDPPGWRLRYWRAGEAVRLFLSQIERKIKGETRLSWEKILTRPIASVQQSRTNKF